MKKDGLIIEYNGLGMSSSSATLVCFNYYFVDIDSFSFRRMIRAIADTRCCILLNHLPPQIPAYFPYL